MKKQLYLSLFSLLPLFAAAQPVIQNMEKYTLGSKFSYVDCDPDGVSPLSGGANNHWMFTSLSSQDTFETEVYSPGATPHSAKFPTANIALLSDDGTFTYYNQTTPKSYLAGIIDTGSDLEYVFNNTALSSVRPIGYNYTETDTFTSSVSESGATLTGGGTIKLTADGWGMLHLPNKNYTDVLRIKLEHTEADSASVGPQTIHMNINRTAYMWFSNDAPYALLVWDSTNLSGDVINLDVKSVSYLLDAGTDVNSVNAEKNNIHAALNHNKLTLRGTFNADTKYDAALFNLNGQKIYQAQFTGGQNQNVFNMPVEPVAGIYLLMLTTGNGDRNVLKIVKE